MGSYTYKNTKTGKTKTEEMTMSEWDEFLEKNPHCHWVPVAANGLVDPHRIGRIKPDGGFTDLLKTIKKGNPRSFIRV